ncbi:MAG: LytTR family DNA-binding domain-containing protein [Eubacteriales bacterium]
MIKIAICDDDIHITFQIEDLIHEFEKLNEFEIEVYSSGEELLRGINEQNERYDLIFLDVEMGVLNGIDTAHEIRKLDKYCLIIYITTYVKFAPTAFEVNAFRFLPKPINKEKFKKYYKAATNEIVKSPNHFMYTFKRENFKILISDIMYFESMQRQTYICLSNGSQKRCYLKLNDVEKQLVDSGRFFYRITQSLLVNPTYVYAYMHDRIVLKNGDEMQIAVNKREKVKELFCKIKGGEIID